MIRLGLPPMGTSSPLENVSKQRWILIALWLGIVLFSSTNWAGHAAGAVFQYLLSLLPDPGLYSSGLARFLAQKGFHVLLFSVLGILVGVIPRGSRLRRVAVCCFFCFMVGGISEGLQYFFPGRQPALTDIVLNGASGTVGAFFGVRS
jgi:VanZ family protein